MQSTSPSRVIVFGSSRDHGNTYQLTQMVAQSLQAPIYNLSDYRIEEFDYEYRNRDDDYIGLIKTLLKADQIILATPVYWYSPSAKMKVFLDRLSDLLDIEKDLGRQLRGKSGAVISTGVQSDAPQCFEDIFRMTYEYLGMEYLGQLYTVCENGFDATKHGQSVATFARLLG